MPRFHVRYTPDSLGTGVKQFCEHLSQGYVGTQYCAHEELSEQKVIHYHIWIDIECVRKTVVNHLVEHFKIPQGKRGQDNKYYMIKEINPDLEQFTLGYIQKDEKLVATNMDPTGLLEALKHYMDTRKPKPEAKAVLVETPLGRSSQSVEDQYEEYFLHMEKQVRLNMVPIGTLDHQFRNKETVNLTWLRKKTRDYYGNKGLGLFAVSSTTKRFQASFYYHYLTKMNSHNDETDIEFKDLGY